MTNLLGERKDVIKTPKPSLHVYLRRRGQQKLLCATGNIMKINCQRLREHITRIFPTSCTLVGGGWRGTCTPADKSSLRMPSRSSTGHCNRGSETRSCFPEGWESTPWGMFRHLTWANQAANEKSMFTTVHYTHRVTLKASGVENQQVRISCDRAGQSTVAHEQSDSAPPPARRGRVSLVGRLISYH